MNFGDDITRAVWWKLQVGKTKRRSCRNRASHPIQKQMAVMASEEEHLQNQSQIPLGEHSNHISVEEEEEEEVAEENIAGNDALLFKTASMSMALGSNAGICRRLSFQPPTALPRRPPAVFKLRPVQARVAAPPFSAKMQPRTVKPTKPSMSLQNPAEMGPNVFANATVNDFRSVSTFPDFHRIRNDGGNPAKGGVVRKAVIVWFRNDLRILDNEALSAANNEALSILPVYCFDPRDYGKSSCGFDKTGPYRANFLLECVANLRANLRERGSDLVVRIGKPEEVLLELAKQVGADALYVHQEVTHEEISAEQKIFDALQDEGLETKFFWGSTLYHISDLPFKLEDMPSNYGGFRDKVQRLRVRSTIEAPKRLKGLPVRGSVQCGEIPTLRDLGLKPQVVQNGKSAANASIAGGESEALERLKTYALECKKQPKNNGKDASGSGSKDCLYGANFSCKISPWLAMGCLSPRIVFEQLKKGEKMPVFASIWKVSGGSGNQGGLNWLLYELLWRDFFRFTTKKSSSTRVAQNTVPTAACAAAVEH